MDNVFIINVGVNASHGRLRSPLFDDGTFEFIPIPEQGRRRSCPDCETLPRYRDLESYNGLHLLNFVPKKHYNYRVHNDPEFVSCTYGDYPTISPRAANLKKLKKGDFIFFLARLVKHRNGVFTKEAGFHFIGYFEVEDILKEVTARPKRAILRRFMNNAHVRRALYDPKFWDGFWVFKGSEGSCRFKYSIPFTKDFAEKILRNSKGHKLIWDKRRTELQIIGSHTRACRIIDNENRLRTFWKTICARTTCDTPE
jgi:hypothetical protein